jgi:hypothetical protein
MKKIKCFYVFAAASVLCSCLSLETIKVKDGFLPVSGEDLTITVNSVLDNRTSVYKNSSVFRPFNMTQVICIVSVSVLNSTDADARLESLSGVEAVFVDDEGRLFFASHSPLVDREFSPAVFKKGAAEPAELFFVHDKGLRAAAVTSGRTRYVLTLPESDAQYKTVVRELEKQPEILRLFDLARTEDFETLDILRKEKDIAIDAGNQQGFTLLYIGILSGNDSVIEGALKNGADVRKTAFLNNILIEPIHAAVMMNNKFAIKALLDAGCSLTAETPGFFGGSPAIAAIKTGNLEALKTLTELGVDLTKERRENSIGGISALSYAQNLGYTGIVEYLRSLQGPENR